MKAIRSLALVVLVLMLVTALVPAHAQIYVGPHFTSATSTCLQGSFTFKVPSFEIADTRPRPENIAALYAEGAPMEVEAWSGSDYLGSKQFWVDPFTGGYYSGTIVYSQQAGDEVTFYLYPVLTVAMPELAPSLGGDFRYFDSITVPSPCEAVPGCDVEIYLPPTAVVGSFVDNADLYWEPGQLITDPALSLSAGKTAWVIGKDSSEQYYEILWGCSFVWVKVGTMGPNYDDVWNGTPLPTDIVE